MSSSPAVVAQAGVTGYQSKMVRRSRTTDRSLFVVAALLVCTVDAVAVSRNTPQTAAVGYICTALALLGCAVAFWRHALCARGLLRIRWFVMVGALLVTSAGYAQSVKDIFGVHILMSKPLQVGLLTAGDAMYVLAIVLFFSSVSRAIVLLDMMQALLLAALRFSLTCTTTTKDHFTSYHLLVSQASALFLFLIAVIAGLGAATSSERRFLRLLSCFFGLRFIGFFLSDQVSYIWLHNQHCSLWDVPFASLLAGFAVYLLWVERVPETVASGHEQAPRPSLVVRSLMPSSLALANLVLALAVLRFSMGGAALSILFAVIAYVARTTLLQSHAFREAARLESRNKHLEGLATRDHLTGIGNRRSLADIYARLQASEATAAGGLALLLMDIDHFKGANDVKGHLYGDQVLIALAKTMEAIGCRVQGSHCARFGGDEFAMLLPGVSPERAVALAEDLRRAFAGHSFEADGRGVSISLGVYCLDEARKLSLEAVIACADAALYRGKTLGRNRVELYVAHQLCVKDKEKAVMGEQMALQRAG